MKKIFYSILFIQFCFSQSTGFSAYGVGENIQNTDPASIALGDGTFYSGNTKNISNNSPSSVWRSSLTRFSVHSGLNFLINKNIPNQMQQSLTSFSLFLPVGDKKVSGFGLQPIYRTNKLIINSSNFEFIGNDQSLTEGPQAFKNNYTIDGGVSEMFFIYSQKINEKLSGGIKYSILFGAQNLNDELYMYDVIIDTITSGLFISEFIEGADTLYISAQNGTMTQVNKFRKFSGSIITLEGRYIYKKHEFALRTSFNSKITVATQNIITDENATYINSFIDV